MNKINDLFFYVARKSNTKERRRAYSQLAKLHYEKSIPVNNNHRDNLESIRHRRDNHRRPMGGLTPGDLKHFDIERAAEETRHEKEVDKNNEQYELSYNILLKKYGKY